MKIDILSLFPEYFQGPLNVSMIKQAKQKKLLEIGLVDIRDFSKEKHKKVDDRPYGGGPGMVLCPEPVSSAIASVKKKSSHVVYLSPQGQTLTSERCQQLSEKKHLVLLCGHYEGVDERVLQKEVDEEISIGDYVLTNGCSAAIVLVDSVIRFIPGVLGHPNAAFEDSFQDQIFDGPHFTRPPVFQEMRVPSVLLEGNHAEIQKWRYERGLEKTKKVRLDLYKKHKKLKGEKSREPMSVY